MRSERAAEIRSAVAGSLVGVTYGERAVPARRVRQAKHRHSFEDLTTRWVDELVRVGLDPRTIEAQVVRQRDRRLVRPRASK